MHEAATMIPANLAASTMRWWIDAGIDLLIDDVPTPWLERAKRPEPQQRTAPAIMPAAAPAALPATLEAFMAWWSESDTFPGAGPARNRIAPSGQANATVMVLFDMPEAGDAQAGRVLSGALGDMFDKMLAGLKLSRETIWLATLMPDRTPTGQIPQDHLARLSEIALHHIGLIAPKTLWVMGQSASRALTGMEVFQARGSKHIINHPGGTTSAGVTFHPRFLESNPSQKKVAWADMQMLIGSESK